MPWEHCGQKIADDQKCPSCALTKEAWTVQWNVTREFQVSGAKAKPFLRFVLLEQDDTEVPAEPYEVVLPDGTTQTGKLDDFGAAKIPVTGGGTCQVKFPQRGDDVWELDPKTGQAQGRYKPKVDCLADGTQQRFRCWPRFLDLLIVDETDTPQADLAYVLTTADGDRKGKTNAEGCLFEDKLPAGDLEIELEDGRLLYFEHGDAEAADDEYDDPGGPPEADPHVEEPEEGDPFAGDWYEEDDPMFLDETGVEEGVG